MNYIQSYINCDDANRKQQLSKESVRHILEDHVTNLFQTMKKFILQKDLNHYSHKDTILGEN